MIYLDYAATTPLRAEARQAMDPYLAGELGNPSSLHAAGQEARRTLDDARDRVAAALGARAEEVIFTSGGTEANNLALVGSFLAQRSRRPHLITAATEHHSILDTCGFLETLGGEITVLPVDRHGFVDPAAVGLAITPRTGLVSIMHANNEVGTVAPLAEIAALTRAAGVPLHTDAVQSVGALPVRMDALGVDLLSLSAHKFYGPPGIGALVARRGVPLRPLLHGGGQERGRRAGTENWIGAIGMARALELAVAEQEPGAVRLAALRDRLIAGVRATVPEVALNGHPTRRLPNNVNLSFAGVEAEMLLLNLDLAGIAASAGSACTAGSLQPSHVLAALGGTPEQLRGSIRMSLGRHTTAAEIDRVVEELRELVPRLRGRPVGAYDRR